MSLRESTNPVIPTTHDRNTRQTFQQDHNGLSYGFHRIQQGKQAYTHHHRLINRLARSDTNPEQVRRHNHQSIPQTLPTQTYVPQVHTIRQWHGIQEPDFRQSDKGSGH